MADEVKIEIINLDNTGSASRKLQSHVDDGWTIFASHLDGSGDSARLVLILEREKRTQDRYQQVETKAYIDSLPRDAGGAIQPAQHSDSTSSTNRE